MLTEPLRAKNMLWIKGNFIHLEAKGSHSDLKSLSQVMKSSRKILFVKFVSGSYEEFTHIHFEIKGNLFDFLGPYHDLK